MFKTKTQKNNKKLWTTMLVILVLAGVGIVLQTQILVMLNDLQASIFGSWVMDINPLPPSSKQMIMDVNPLPPMLVK